MRGINWGVFFKVWVGIHDWDQSVLKSPMWCHKNEGFSISFLGVYFHTSPLISIIFMKSLGSFLTQFGLCLQLVIRMWKPNNQTVSGWRDLRQINWSYLSKYNISKPIIGYFREKANIVLLWRHKTNRRREGGKKISSKEMGEMGFSFLFHEIYDVTTG